MKLHSVTTKIMVAFLIVLSFFTITINYYVDKQVKEKFVLAAQNKLTSDLAMSTALLNMKYPGSWNVEGNKLIKGHTIMNDNSEIVDEIGKLTGDTVTIFMGDTRITTNVQKDGKRAVGTKVSDAVKDVVLKTGATYRGEADVLGTINETIYVPIQNESGEIIGIFYVGVPKKPFDVFAQSISNKIYKISGITLILSLLCSYLISRPTILSIRRLVIATKQIANKDLTQKIQIRSRDEIGELAQSFENMRMNLLVMLSELGDISTNLKENSHYLTEATIQTEQASNEVSKAIQHVASGVTEQTFHTQSIENKMNHTLIEVQKGEKKAEDMFDYAVHSYEVAIKGEQSLKQTIDHLLGVSETVKVATDSIQRLGKRSDEIGGVIQVISDIANQTNLLALNASIEAARAGESGRGFTVVAAEVKKLAEQCKASAGQITELIHGIQADTSITVNMMEDNLDAVEEQVSIISLSGQALQEIVENTSITKENAANLKLTFNNLVEQAEEVKESIQRVAQLVESTAAVGEEVAASSEEQLASANEISSVTKGVMFIANNLNRKVEEFTIK
ncbi:methyl-accepting chemotaxis protein [Paenibacillus roseipurpureus]|uniref:Methyl-accepting chemotaxis protein n=1 Tax=Paenibacillus roseopurpureus TaxID=2918901 RepID=A0AA96LRM9_9BACL|nr:methyl-accepting chemotaxis protein [Paenibacillus sp. MBLB1832]WNR45311.1 methyl-accepting chemotaxis protein [Paenibacillus sp. MBLB1832]